MAELRDRIMQDVGQAKLVFTEEDMPQLMELENLLIGQARQPIAQMQAQGMLPQGGPQQPMGVMAGGGPGGGVGGLSQGVNVDELRRMLQQPGSNF